MLGKRSPERQRIGMLDEIIENDTYREMKWGAEMRSGGGWGF